MADVEKETPEETTGSDRKNVESEIDTAIEDTIKQDQADRDAREGKAEPEDDKSDTGADADDDTNLEVDDSKAGADDKGGKAPEVTDAQIERAVKAGMTLAEAREVTNPATLDRLVTMLEAKAPGKAGDDDEGAAGATGGEGDEEDPFAGIPDLDPEEYDEKIVGGFKAMKALIKQQFETIKGLRTEGTGNWFDTQVATLASDKGVEVGEKRSELKAKFDVLSAGYKAAGQDVGQDTIFDEAARMVLTDELTTAQEKSDRADLQKRKQHRVARPGSGNAAPVKDPLDEIAEEIDRKHFGKK